MPYVNTNSSEKGKQIIKIFNGANGVDESNANNVNLVNSERLEESRLANKSDLLREIDESITPLQSAGEIVVPKAKKHLVFVFRSSVHVLDKSNPSYGVLDGADIKELNEQLIQADLVKNEGFLIYGGDYCGIEEQIKYLNNAKIIEKIKKNEATTEEKKQYAILYFGLEARIKTAVKELTYITKKNPKVNIMLFDGYQEHYVKSYFKYEFWNKVIERLDPETAKKVDYIKGVNTMVPVRRKTSKGEYVAYVGFLTNNGMLKSINGNTALNTIYRCSGVPSGDQNFVLNSPINGKRGANIYCVTLDCMYIPSTKGKFNQPAPRGYNAFTLDVVGNNNICVNEGLPMMTNPLEQQLFNNLTIQSAIENEYTKFVKEKMATAGHLRKTGTVEEFSEKIKAKQKEIDALSESNDKVIIQPSVDSVTPHVELEREDNGQFKDVYVNPDGTKAEELNELFKHAKTKSSKPTVTSSAKDVIEHAKSKRPAPQTTPKRDKFGHFVKTTQTDVEIVKDDDGRDKE